MTHLSLEASKKIFELIGDYETEQNYSEQAEPDCLCGEHGDPGYILTPKPNFAELIRKAEACAFFPELDPDLFIH